MNILHVYKDYHPVLGGIENHVRVLAENQAAAGHRVSVAVCARRGAPAGDCTINGVKVARAGRWCTVRSMPVSTELPRLVRRAAADIVHVHSPFPLGEWAALRLPRRVRVVTTHHSDIVKQKVLVRFYGPALRHFLRRVDRIVVTSEAYAASSPWLQPHAAKWRVVPLGVDPTVFTASGPAAADAAPLLFVGRLRYYKGLDTLLESLTNLPGARLDIVGEGPMKTRWMELAARLHVADRVRFLGDVEEADLPRRYRGARLFVLPANCRAEAFGTVLLEAMACGLPAVTTELGTGTSWVVQDGVSGRVVTPSNPVRLAEAVRSLLADESLRRRMAAAAVERVKAHFTLRQMLAGVEAVYREIA